MGRWHMKKILITGNLGYLGSYLGKYLRDRYEYIDLIGFDAGFFSHALTGTEIPVDYHYSKQIYGDVREFDFDSLRGVDAVVNLAAVSNDPMGSKFEKVTEEINRSAVVKICKEAAKAGVKNIVFASSCSMYGAATGTPKTEEDGTNPQTAYARSKIGVEDDLLRFNFDGAVFTALRFSTACGFTPRTRLDLVLNDFVFSAIKHKRIDILSNGTPWRPLIHVHDMCRAIDWAIFRDDEFNNIQSVNIGSNKWNYKVIDLAKAVAAQVGDVEISINESAPPDRRSYQVDFSLFNRIAPCYQPEITLEFAVEDLIRGLSSVHLDVENFRDSNLIRLRVLQDLIEKGVINDQLRYLK